MHNIKAEVKEKLKYNVSKIVNVAAMVQLSTTQKNVANIPVLNNISSYPECLCANYHERGNAWPAKREFNSDVPSLTV